jgi:hypothetical protein
VAPYRRLRATDESASSLEERSEYRYLANTLFVSVNLASRDFVGNRDDHVTTGYRRLTITAFVQRPWVSLGSLLAILAGVPVDYLVLWPGRRGA